MTDDSYQKLKLPKGKKTVSLFVDQETETKLKTDEDKQDSNYVFLAKLSLDRLGLINRALSILGVLSLKTLYVSAPWHDVTTDNMVA